MSRLRSDDSGANPIELAILFPLIVIALFASIQVSLYYLAKSEALAAAQAGATAQRGYGAPPGAATQQATAYIHASHGWLVNVQPTVVNPAPIPPAATHITVTVSGDALSLVPGWRGWHVSETAGGQLERISQPGGP